MTETELVWNALDRGSFAVIAYVTPAGEPRSSGVVFKAVNRRLYVAVAPDSWKARHVTDGSTVSVTVPIRRGGLLSLVLLIPPATISFHAMVRVHPAGALDIGSVSKELESLLPPQRTKEAVVFELVPTGRFVTYGVGVPLMEVANPDEARSTAPGTAWERP